MGLNDERPRKPTFEEKVHIVDCIGDLWGMGISEAASLVENAAIAVFDRYQTSSPGYAGGLILVCWEGGESFYTCFTWKGAALVHNDKAENTVITNLLRDCRRFMITLIAKNGGPEVVVGREVEKWANELNRRVFKILGLEKEEVANLW